MNKRDQVYSALDHALNGMSELRTTEPSRELSVAITEAETALLWLRQDFRRKEEIELDQAKQP